MPYFLLLALLLLTGTSYCQDEGALEKESKHYCQRSGYLAKTSQISYYQYPAMLDYDLNYLRIEAELIPGNAFIQASAHYKARVTAPLDSFIIELSDLLTVDSVRVNGERFSFLRSANHIFIPAGKVLQPGVLLDISIYYQGNVAAGAFYKGTTASGLTYTASLSESFRARDWFPAKQILEDKIDSTDMWITVPAGNMAGSNGILTDSIVLPGNKRQFRWKSRYPINYYLPSVAVGNYREYRNFAKPAGIAPDSILIQHFFVNSNTYFNNNKVNLDKTPRFLEVFSELFGTYPFKNEKYGHCQASIGGGMEHQTMSTMQNFGSTLIAHELAHQWWGDQVTCKQWNDIWLHEGFATYGEYLMIEKLPTLFTGVTTDGYMNEIHNSVKASAGGSVYVADSMAYDESRIFDFRLSYQKGAAILHNLRLEVGNDSVFFHILKSFLSQYSQGTATTEAFKQKAESISGKELDFFFDQWYYGEGYPTHSIDYFSHGSDSLILFINQSVSMPSKTPFFKGILPVRITSSQFDSIYYFNIISNQQQFSIYFPGNPSNISIDPNNWVINNSGSINFGGILPISITNWQATKNSDCVAQVSWTAQYEVPGISYTVQFSKDGFIFSDLAEIPGKAAAISHYEYNFQMTESGLYYIRIRLNEGNGNYSYSEFMALNNDCIFPENITLQPNPVSDMIQLTITSGEYSVSEINILNMNGSMIYRRKENIHAGINQVNIPVSFLPKGSYVLSCIAPSGLALRKRFVKR
jgi:hypothetical protein